MESQKIDVLTQNLITERFMINHTSAVYNINDEVSPRNGATWDEDEHHGRLSCRTYGEWEKRQTTHTVHKEERPTTPDTLYEKPYDKKTWKLWKRRPHEIHVIPVGEIGTNHMLSQVCCVGYCVVSQRYSVWTAPINFHLHHRSR